MFAYREHDDFLKPIESMDDIYRTSLSVLDNEYTGNCQMNLKAMKYITHFQLPTFIYFDHDPINKPFFKVFEHLALQYKDYMMFCTANLDLIQSDHQSDLKFYTNILAGGVPKRSKKGFVRIVNYKKELKRYRVKGKLTHGLADFLIVNYLHENLNQYIASESFGEKNFIKLKNGLRKINNDKLEEIKDHMVTTHLIYIYSSQTEDYLEHIKVLETLARALENNKLFSISIMDHDRNDIDDRIHENLPYMYLANKVYDKRKFAEEINFTNLLSFLAENLSWLKIKDEFMVELRDVHGINLIEEDL